MRVCRFGLPLGDGAVLRCWCEGRGVGDQPAGGVSRGAPPTASGGTPRPPNGGGGGGGLLVVVEDRQRTGAGAGAGAGAAGAAPGPVAQLHPLLARVAGVTAVGPRGPGPGARGGRAGGCGAGGCGAAAAAPTGAHPIPRRRGPPWTTCRNGTEVLRVEVLAAEGPTRSHSIRRGRLYVPGGKRCAFAPAPEEYQSKVTPAISLLDTPCMQLVGGGGNEEGYPFR